MAAKNMIGIEPGFGRYAPRMIIRIPNPEIENRMILPPKGIRPEEFSRVPKFIIPGVIVPSKQEKGWRFPARAEC